MAVRSAARKPVAWLVAAALGVAGALTAVTPAQAASTCVLNVKATQWPAADGSARWLVEGALTNRGTATSTTWTAYLRFPATATVRAWWNVSKQSAASTSFWRPVEWNAALQPGARATFGFEVRTPDYRTSALPVSTFCDISY